MTAAEPKYLIAIVMPVLNEETYLGRTLDQVYMQDFPMDRVEIVIADGGSTDRTREVAEKFKNRFGSLKILDNPGRKPSTGRNVGVKNTTAPYVLVLDGHIYIPSKTLLKDMLEIFERTESKCLCRPQPLQPPDITEFEKSVALCRGSFLGHKPGSEIYADFEAQVDPTSSGAMYRREVFDEIGYFDERFDACEDVDFNFRVNRAGLKSFLSPKLTVLYYPRSGLPGLWRQMVRYGLGRFRLSIKHRLLTPSQLIAGAGVLGFALMLLLSLIAPPVLSLFRTITGIYILIVVFTSAYLTWRHRHLGCLLYGPLIFPTVHFGLGYGFLTGVFGHFIKKQEGSSGVADVEL